MPISFIEANNPSILEDGSSFLGYSLVIIKVDTRFNNEIMSFLFSINYKDGNLQYNTVDIQLEMVYFE